MKTAMEVALQVGIAAACRVLGVARATFYREQRPVSVQQANVCVHPHRMVMRPSLA